MGTHDSAWNKQKSRRCGLKLPAISKLCGRIFDVFKILTRYPPVIQHGVQENPPFMDGFPSQKPPIYMDNFPAIDDIDDTGGISTSRPVSPDRSPGQACQACREAAPILGKLP